MIQGQTLIAASAARDAELKETARTLVRGDLPGAQELVGQIARELERAFQRGAAAGARLEAVSREDHEFLTWDEVPASVRWLWFTLGIHQCGSRRHPKRWTVWLALGGDVLGHQGWRMFWVTSAKGVRKPGPLVYSDEDVSALVATGLVAKIKLEAGTIVVLTPLGERSFKQLSWYR